MKKILIVVVSVLALLFAIVGCEGESGVPGPNIDSISAELIVEDQATDNETIQPEQGNMNVRIDITVSNFEAVDAIGDNVTDNETEGDGYYIYYLNILPSALMGAEPGMEPTPAPEQTDQGQGEMAVASTDTSYTWEGVEPGINIFSVQLVNTDGTPLLRPVVAAVILSVPAADGMPPVGPPMTTPPAEPGTETPTEPSTETPTEPSTETPTEPGTETPTEPGTETPTEPTGPAAP